MRTYRIRVLLLAIICLFVGQVMAQDTVTGRPVVGLNVRSGPGVDHAIITVIYPYHRVRVIGRNNFDPNEICPSKDYPLSQWLLVDVQGIEGWVVRCGMRVNASISSLPLLADDGTPIVSDIVLASESEELNRYPTYVGIRAPAFGDSLYPIGRARGFINVRNEPSLTSEIQFVMGAGSQFFVVEESDDGAWYRIEWSSNRYRRDAELQTGWVARHLVAIVRYI